MITREGRWNKATSTCHNRELSAWYSPPIFNFQVIPKVCFVTIGIELLDPPDFKDYVGFCVQSQSSSSNPVTSVIHITNFFYSDSQVKGLIMKEEEGGQETFEEFHSNSDEDFTLSKNFFNTNRKRLVVASGLLVKRGEYQVIACTQHPEQEGN
eukprot:TRINITY_DN22639_c0_g1_i1.p1 TRINITY_DN22639_c0_g1~~TRINITY_DN22639_c0_g1_i1.p1  ORF type:complete len:154 (-),score=32.26 TRINITY_DN22639_c0_g1_i1:78-539(-)